LQGYLKPLARGHHQRELTRTYMCGLCHLFGEHYGFIYRLFAQPDLVFLNVFLDAVDQRPAPFVNKSCPLLPVVSNAPVRAQTHNARFAAAFGLYMGVEKLRDNHQDEGGLHRWLLWRVFQPGFVKARQELLAQGFPVPEVERWMAANARLEKRPTLSLQRAVRPSAAISGLMFAHAGRHATAATRTALRGAGEALGAFLFFMDSLLDYGSDGRAGQYNPFLRLPPAEQDNTAAVLEHGTQQAQARVEQLAQCLSVVPMDDPHGFVRSTLVDGLRDKVRRYRALNATQRLTATLSAVEPPPGSVLLHVVRHALTQAAARARLALALVLTWLAPKSPALARLATVLVVAACSVVPNSAFADGGPDGGDAGLDGGPDAGNAMDAAVGGGTNTGSSSGGNGGDGQVDCCPNCGDVCCSTPCGWCCGAYQSLGCGNIIAQCPCIYCCLVCK